MSAESDSAAASVAAAVDVAPRSCRYVGTVRVLTVNDVYSALPVDGCGGWAMLQTLLARYRTPTSLVCINGDFLGGSALAEHHQGKNVVQIMNAPKTDLVVLGNHEFDQGPTVLKERMRESKFVWLGSNVREKRNATDPDDDEASQTLFEGVQNLQQVRVQLEREVVNDVAPPSLEDDNAASPPAPSSSPSPAIPFPSSTPAMLGLFGVCTPHTPHLSWPGPLVAFAPVNGVLEQCVRKLKGHEVVHESEVGTLLDLPRSVDQLAPVTPTAIIDTTAHLTHIASPTAASSATPPPPETLTPSDGIIAVTHLSFNEDRKIARAYGDSISVVLGGHDHDPIAMVENGTLLFKAGQNAFWLGVIDLRIEVTLTEKSEAATAAASTSPPAPGTAAAASASSPTSSPSPPSSSSDPFVRTVQIHPSWSMVQTRGVREDPHVTDMIQASIRVMEQAQSNEDQNEVICRIEAPTALPHGMSTLSPELAAALLVTKTSSVRKSSSSFADMVADSMAYHYAEDGCSGAMINGGFIRGDKVYALGTELTLRDIRYELPFPKVAVLLKISGRGIWQALDQMLQAHPNPSGSFPHMSSQFHVEFDATSGHAHQKVKSVTHLGQPIDLEREYKLAVTTFMASGGDGITAFTEYGQIVSTDAMKASAPVADLVLKYLRGCRVLRPNIVPRVVARGTGLGGN